MFINEINNKMTSTCPQFNIINADVYHLHGGSAVSESRPSSCSISLDQLVLSEKYSWVPCEVEMQQNAICSKSSAEVVLTIPS